MKTISRSYGRLLAPLTIAGFFSTPAVHAAVTTASSSAYGISANLALVGGVVNLNVVAAAPVSGTAPPAYSSTNTVATVGVNTALLGSINTGVINTLASSTVDGTPGSKNASASAVVNGLNVNLGIPNVIPALAVDILRITADTVTSSATLSGDFSSLSPSGASIVTNLNIAVFGDTLTIPAEAFTTPNFLLFDFGGIRIVTNAQTSTGDGTSAAGFSNTAIQVTLANVAGLGSALNGSINIASSNAALNAIPEPGAAMLGLAGAALLIRRRRSNV